MKGEPYRRITPAALARNAPPQSGLRPASSTFYGIAATGSYFELDSLRDAPPGGDAFSHIIVVLLCYLWISISFSTFFSKPVKKNPYTTKALLFYVLVSHANPKNSTGLSLSVEFFPSISFLKRFQSPSLAFENQLFSRISRNFSTGYSNIVETFLQQGRECGKQERGRAPGFSRVSAPFGLIFCFFHRLQPVFHMIYPQLWKQLWINLRICSLQVSVCYLLCR